MEEDAPPEDGPPVEGGENTENVPPSEGGEDTENEPPAEEVEDTETEPPAEENEDSEDEDGPPEDEPVEGGEDSEDKPTDAPKPTITVEEPEPSTASTTTADACEETGAAEFIDLPDNPRCEEARDAFKEYCSSPITEPEKAKKALLARSKPYGYLSTEMGGTKATKKGGQGLWSGGFGTCVGIIIPGKPPRSNGHSVFLSHIGLGDSLDHIRL